MNGLSQRNSSVPRTSGFSSQTSTQRDSSSQNFLDFESDKAARALISEAIDNPDLDLENAQLFNTVVNKPEHQEIQYRDVFMEPVKEVGNKITETSVVSHISEGLAHALKLQKVLEMGSDLFDDHFQSFSTPSFCNEIRLRMGPLLERIVKNSNQQEVSSFFFPLSIFFLPL